MVRLYYWAAKPNAGDYYSMWLAKKIYKSVSYDDICPNLIITGSILGHQSVTNDTTVWGAGWHNSIYNDKCSITSHARVKALRGKLSAEFLKIKPSSIALGDPGLLASRYYTPKAKKAKKKITVICHWRDYEKVSQAYGAKYNVVSMQTNDVEKILDEIWNSELVLSTSLHGIIFAHSFGVPAKHILASKPESIGCFKFKDYYSVLDIPYESYELNFTSDEEEFERIYATRESLKPSAKVVSKIQDSLLSAKPKKSELFNPKACLCAIAKNENNYIREWVEHHKKLGFDNIFIYDNNDVDGEHFGSVIGDYIKSGYVRIIDVRGKSNQQIKCYNEFYHSTAKRYDWVAFFDIDEFLNLDCGSVKTLLSMRKYKPFDGIAVNWKYFDDNGLAEISNGNYSVKRFTREFKEADWEWAQHRFSKRIMKTNKNLVINSSHGPIACAQMNEYKSDIKNNLNLCNIAGQKLHYNHLAIKNWSHDGGYLAHYRYKTIEEYITNKMKRGYPTLYKNSGKDMNINEFFALNHRSADKIKKIAQLLKVSVEEVEAALDGKELNAVEKLKAEKQQHQTQAKPAEPAKKKKKASSGYYLYF